MHDQMIILNQENMVHPLTKGLPRDQVYYLSKRMGLKPIN